jgi:hypothetical protein
LSAGGPRRSARAVARPRRASSLLPGRRRPQIVFTLAALVALALLAAASQAARRPPAFPAPRRRRSPCRRPDGGARVRRPPATTTWPPPTAWWRLSAYVPGRHPRRADDTAPRRFLRRLSPRAAGCRSGSPRSGDHRRDARALTLALEASGKSHPPTLRPERPLAVAQRHVLGRLFRERQAGARAPSTGCGTVERRSLLLFLTASAPSGRSRPTPACTCRAEFSRRDRRASRSSARPRTLARGDPTRAVEIVKRDAGEDLVRARSVTRRGHCRTRIAPRRKMGQMRLLGRLSHALSRHSPPRLASRPAFLLVASAPAPLFAGEGSAATRRTRSRRRLLLRRFLRLVGRRMLRAVSRGFAASCGGGGGGASSPDRRLFRTPAACSARS